MAVIVLSPAYGRHGLRSSGSPRRRILYGTMVVSSAPRCRSTNMGRLLRCAATCAREADDEELIANRTWANQSLGAGHGIELEESPERGSRSERNGGRDDTHASHVSTFRDSPVFRFVRPRIQRATHGRSQQPVHARAFVSL